MITWTYNEKSQTLAVIKLIVSDPIHDRDAQSTCYIILPFRVDLHIFVKSDA
jgi:hypothetical protein